MPVTYAQLGPDGVRKLVEASLANPQQRERRVEYARRRLILSDRFGPLVYQRIAHVYAKKTSHVELSKFVNAGTNVLGRVVRELAFVYQRPPTRRLELAGPVGDALNKRFADGLAQSRIAARAKKWGQFAFALNVVWVLPGVWQRHDGLKLEHKLITPDVAERITSDDPNYTDILLWPRGVVDYGAGVSTSGWYATDGEAYYWLDKKFAVERAVPHGLGRQPALELRVSDPDPDDFWDIGRGSRATEATIECGRIAAAMSWVRKGQNRKLVTAFGKIGDMDRDQQANPEGAVAASTDDPDDIEFAVHEFSTAIKDFADEMRWHVEQAVESYGTPVTTVDFEVAGSGDATGGPQIHAAQAELRDDQIEYVRPFELDLAVTSNALMARFGHPFSVAPEIVAQSYSPRWQPMVYVDQPLQRMAVYEAKMGLGLMTHGDAYLEEYGGRMTPEEANQHVLDNLKAKAAIDLFYAAHNIGVDPRVQSLPQIQGRMGGQASPPQRNEHDQQSALRQAHRVARPQAR